MLKANASIDPPQRRKLPPNLEHLLNREEDPKTSMHSDAITTIAVASPPIGPEGPTKQDALNALDIIKGSEFIDENELNVIKALETQLSTGSVGGDAASGMGGGSHSK